MRSPRRSHHASRRLRRPRSQALEVERLEGRLVLAANGLPDLDSLPGAPTAIYLDFDGHGSTLASIGRSFLTSCSCSAMFAVAMTTRCFSWCAW